MEAARRITVSLNIAPDRPSQHADNKHGSVPFMRAAEASEPAKSLQADWETGEIVCSPSKPKVFGMLTENQGLSYLLGPRHRVWPQRSRAGASLCAILPSITTHTH